MTLLLCLLCLLLCGCAQNAPPPETAPATSATEPLFDPTASLEEAYREHLQAYPLSTRKTLEILPLGEDILTLSGYGNTTLTLLQSPDMTAAASMTLEFELSSQDPSLRLHEEVFSFYDPIQGKTLILDSKLQEIAQIQIPEPIQGSPILSTDRKTLYYITDSAIIAWDLQQDIHRTVKELSYEQQTLTGLHLEDSVLQCRIQEGTAVHTRFLSTATGQLLTEAEGAVPLTTQDGRYYMTLNTAGLSLPVFGQAGDLPQILYPEDAGATHFFLPPLHAAITCWMDPDDRTELTWYDLYEGTPSASVTLAPLETPKAILSTANGKVFFLTYHPGGDCDILYQWDPAAPVFATGSQSLCIAPYPQAPESLAHCQDYANRLSQKYGITIRIGDDALVTQPWDYCFEAETLPQILLQELASLDERLSQYPKTVLAQTAAHFSSLNLSLVRSITGSPASGSLDAATGVQFLDGTDAYVVISVGKYAQQALCHELYHVMETHILNESAAMDQWNEWNPRGFVYSFTSQPNPGWEEYLSGEKQAFIDSYSMTYPKEDRARVFEAAMLPGNGHCFSSPTMQTKLIAQCQAIRQAYGLRRAEEIFPWEQYLENPLDARRSLSP